MLDLVISKTDVVESVVCGQGLVAKESHHPLLEIEINLGTYGISSILSL